MAYLSQDQKPVGHYVYEHRTHNGRLFYIGKGKGERAYTKNGRNQYDGPISKITKKMMESKNDC